MKRTSTRRRRTTKATPSRKLSVLGVIIVAIAAYVYFSSNPGAAEALVREVFGLGGPPAASAPTVRPVPPTALPRATALPGETQAPPTALPRATALPGETQAPPTEAPVAAVDGRELLGAAYPQLPSGLERGRVVDVIDGDTVDVELGGVEVRLRLIGLDTPESVDPRKPVECYGVEASNRAKELLTGQTVLLEIDPSQDERDRYGRALRFVWLEDGRLFNLEMLAQGYAFEYTYDAKYKYQASFRQAQEMASERQLGLWSAATCGGEHRPAEG